MALPQNKIVKGPMTKAPMKVLCLEIAVPKDSLQKP